MFASEGFPRVAKKRKPYSPPSLTKLTPEAAQAALESLGRRQVDERVAAAKKLAGASHSQGEVPTSRDAAALVKGLTAVTTAQKRSEKGAAGRTAPLIRTTLRIGFPGILLAWLSP